MHNILLVLPLLSVGEKKKENFLSFLFKDTENQSY